MRRFLPIAVALLGACSGSQGDTRNTTDSAPSETITAQSAFEAEIVPILTSSCATCHLTGQEAGNMALVPGKALATLVNVPSTEAPGLIRVVPGDPDKSYLVMKLEGTQITHGGTGAQMPFGAPPLSPDKIARIRQWITDGAKP